MELLDRRVRQRAHEFVDAPRVEAPLPPLRRRPRPAPAELEGGGEPRPPEPRPARAGEAPPTDSHASSAIARLAAPPAPSIDSRSPSDSARGPSSSILSRTSFLAISFSSEPVPSPHRPLTPPWPGRTPPTAPARVAGDASTHLVLRGGGHRSKGVRPGEGRDRRGAPGFIGRTGAGAALAPGARSAL